MRRLLIYSSVIWSAVTMSSCLTALTLLGAFDSASSSSSYAKGGFRYSYCINDFWVNWRDEKLSNVGIKGGYDEMWFVRADKPWEVYCHFKINSFYIKIVLLTYQNRDLYPYLSMKKGMITSIIPMLLKWPMNR